MDSTSLFRVCTNKGLVLYYEALEYLWVFSGPWSFVICPFLYHTPQLSICGTDSLRLYHPDAKDLTYCYMPIIIIKFQYFMFLFPLLLLYNILIIFIMCTLYSLWLHFLFFKLYFMTLTLVKTSLEWWVSSSPTFCVSIENTLVIRTRNFLFLLKDMNYKHCLVPKWPA